MQSGFHGSYVAEDVTFLLKQLSLKPIADIHEKERLIQSGQRHYSEMLGAERLPSEAYLSLFHAAVDRNARRMARDLVMLARRICAVRPHGVTLVSMARAGTPVGVLLRRLLVDLMGVVAPHYSISVIRDRGLDLNALDHILVRQAAQTLVFVDGWTAKGSIHKELVSSLADFESSRGKRLAPELFVLSDLAGVAYASGSTEDYLIPSALLNSTVSGLVSRSVLNEQIGPADFHGCVYYREWLGHDASRWFIARVMAEVNDFCEQWLGEPLPEPDVEAIQQRSAELIRRLSSRYSVQDVNFIKPGIGESTRALLRRTSRMILLRDPTAAEVRHLVQLAHERGVAVEADPSLPFHAVAIIRSLADG